MAALARKMFAFIFIMMPLSLFYIFDVETLTDIDMVNGTRHNSVRNLNTLSKLMQKRLKVLQNPVNCTAARKLVCSISDFPCGFGCYIHHLAYCLLMAYGSERTLVLQGDGKSWSYSSKGWTSAFLPISYCSDRGPPIAEMWNSLEAIKAGPQVVSVPISDNLVQNRPPFLMPSLPKDISTDLIQLHGYPPAWLRGQFIQYLMRSSQELEMWLKEAERKIRFEEGAIVGIQVRRTDKLISEAKFHGIEEYMVKADRWFADQSLKLGKKLKKRVFIATDETSVINEARLNFKEFEILADINVAVSASVNTRYTDASLFGVVSDVRMLSKCDYLVCTFTSNLCQLAYELMQAEKGNAADLVHSLDEILISTGQFDREQEAIIAHSPASDSEIMLEVGDVLFVKGNGPEGFLKGRNYRTGKEGLYPYKKVKEKWRIREFPLYPNVIL